MSCTNNTSTASLWALHLLQPPCCLHTQRAFTERWPFFAAPLQQRRCELLYSLTFMTWHRDQQMLTTLSFHP